MGARLGKMAAVALDVAVIGFLFSAAVMRSDYEAFYEGDIGTGTSLAYVARFYEDRGFSLEGSAYGLAHNGTLINLSGLIVHAHRYSVLFGGGGENLVVYSDDQKLKEPVPLELDPLYVRVKAVKTPNKMTVYARPGEFGDLGEVKSLGQAIADRVEEAGMGAQVYVNLKLVDQDLLRGVREGKIPIYWVETVVNRRVGGIVRFAGSTDYPLYLSFEDVPLEDVGEAAYVLRPFLGNGSLFVYDLRFKVAIDGEIPLDAKARMISTIRGLPGIDYVKFSTAFKEEG